MTTGPFLILLIGSMALTIVSTQKQEDSDMDIESQPENNETTKALQPIFRLDCPINHCLYFSNNCPSDAECAMNQHCNGTVCVSDHRKTTPAPPTPATTSKPPDPPTFRIDCTINYCLYYPNMCPSDAECAMNQHCNKTVCVDKQGKMAPTPTPAISNDMPEGTTSRLDCPTNLCLHLSNCTSDEECAMSEDCNTTVCIAKTFPAKATAPDEEDRGVCFSTYECVHGKCRPDKTGCICDKYWQGTTCNRPCTMDCVNGNCFIDQKGQVYMAPENITKDNMFCNCNFGWTGNLCEEIVPDLVDEAQQRTLKLGLSLGGALLVTLVGSTIALIVLWRKRVIVVMKLVYFFKLKEHDDGRIYDAYISMGSSTRGLEFVKNQLCPKLENYGFRLYVQARDQMVNEALHESIVNAMAKSRRTILIITLDYLENEWSRFEYLIAQIETLKLQQRIIPIVLEDISTERKSMNKTLKHIMDSVKCLTFPRPKEGREVVTSKQKNREKTFWKRLELTMPKTKSTPSERTIFNSNSKPSELDLKNGNPLNGNFTNIYSVV